MIPRFTSALTAIDRLRAHGGIMLLLAGPGTGKSCLLEHYAHTRSGDDLAGPLFHLRADVVSTPLGLVRTLLEHFDVGWNGSTRGGLAVLLSNIRSTPLLLVDDAHRLSVSALELLRSLHDAHRFRLVLGGPTRMKAGLIRKAPELMHRVTDTVWLDNLTLAELQVWLPPTLQPFATPLRMVTRGNPFWLTTVLEDARREARRRHAAQARVLEASLQHRHTA
jgi:hypothetical protein